MAEYIEIDAPIDMAVYQRNRRIKVTLRQILESNDAKYERADVRPVRRGKWGKYVGENGVTSACRCSLCGFEDNRFSVFNYCPNCGADMRETKDEKT